MDRVFASGASATPPAPPAIPSTGYPTAGNPGTGTEATKPGEYWYHMITEEIRAVLVAAGLTPNHNDLTQLAAAIEALAVANIASTTAAGVVELADSAEAQGLIDPAKALTPFTLSQAFKGANQSLGANGYQKLPGGLIVQGGTHTTTSAGSNNLTFPVAWPNGLIAIAANLDIAVGSNAAFINFYRAGGTLASTPTYARDFNNLNYLTITYSWIAIGY